MATVFASIKGIKILSEFEGPEKGGTAEVTFALTGAYVAGTDVVQLGGGGFDGGLATTATLQTIMQNRRRDGKTVTLVGTGGSLAPGQQSGTPFYAQVGATALSASAGNLQCNLFNAATGGAGVSATASGVQDRPIAVTINYVTT